MNVIKGARRLVDVLTGTQHGPIRRLELLADELQVHLAAMDRLRVALTTRSEQRSGTVLCLARRLDLPGGGPHSQSYISAIHFTGVAGEQKDRLVGVDIPLAAPIWIVAVGALEIESVALGIDVQSPMRSGSSPVFLVDQPWELGRLLNVRVRLT